MDSLAVVGIMEGRVGMGGVFEMCCEHVECPDRVELSAYGNDTGWGHWGGKWRIKSEEMIINCFLHYSHAFARRPMWRISPPPLLPRVILPCTRYTRRDAQRYYCPFTTHSPFSPPPPSGLSRHAPTTTATAGQRWLRHASSPLKAHAAPPSKLTSHHRRHLRSQAWHPSRRADGLAERRTSWP